MKRYRKGEQMKSVLFIIVVAAVVLLTGANIIFAQGPETKVLPDLTVNSIVFSPQPKAGELIGTITITISNIGKNDAGENILNFECVASDCEKDSDCQAISDALTGTLAVPSIKKNEILELTWVRAKEVRWVTGNYLVAAIIDGEGKIEESDETNNKKQEVVFLKQFSPER
ncbi:MAG: hypothetical protein FJZ15_05485 [Candidatus Omnitrophica bacterium]|nr:hypothetical protein [Candidatus Omnitrophota bacterium]